MHSDDGNYHAKMDVQLRLILLGCDRKIRSVQAE